ncbi:MAG: hypothetical protein WC742_11850 [Gallionellaceae bacterium]|jgi:hypothetical protein
MPINRFNKRQISIGVLLLLTVLATLWPVEDDITSTESTLSPSRESQTDSNKVPLLFKPLLPKNSASNTSTITNLFPQQSWAPLAPPVIQHAPVAAPPPPPAPAPAIVIPPLPFVFAGRYSDDNVTTIFLTENNKMHRVQQGDTINGTYLIKKIEQSYITITYLPLGVTQTLSTGLLLP